MAWSLRRVNGPPAAPVSSVLAVCELAPPPRLDWHRSTRMQTPRHHQNGRGKRAVTRPCSGGAIRSGKLAPSPGLTHARGDDVQVGGGLMQQCNRAASTPRQVPEMEGRGGALRRERVSGSGRGVVPPSPSNPPWNPPGSDPAAGARLPGLGAPQILLQNVDPCPLGTPMPAKKSLVKSIGRPTLPLTELPSSSPAAQPKTTRQRSRPTTPGIQYRTPPKLRRDFSRCRRPSLSSKRPLRACQLPPARLQSSSLNEIVNPAPALDQVFRRLSPSRAPPHWLLGNDVHTQRPRRDKESLLSR